MMNGPKKSMALYEKRRAGSSLLLGRKAIFCSSVGLRSRLHVTQLDMNLNTAEDPLINQ